MRFCFVVDHDAVTRSVVFNDKLLAFAKHWDSDHGRVRRIALAPKARPRTASECEEKRHCRSLLCNLGKPSRRTSMSGRGKGPTPAFTAHGGGARSRFLRAGKQRR